MTIGAQATNGPHEAALKHKLSTPYKAPLSHEAQAICALRAIEAQAINASTCECRSTSYRRSLDTEPLKHKLSMLGGPLKLISIDVRPMSTRGSGSSTLRRSAQAINAAWAPPQLCSCAFEMRSWRLFLRPYTEVVTTGERQSTSY